MFLPCLRTAQSALCHNPFMNQVYFHVRQFNFKWHITDDGHNPFMNQVYFHPSNPVASDTRTLCTS